MLNILLSLSPSATSASTCFLRIFDYIAPQRRWERRLQTNLSRRLRDCSAGRFVRKTGGKTLKFNGNFLKWMLIASGAVIAAAALITGCRMKKQHISDDCIDGGVVKYSSGDDAPKVIESTEISRFCCEISLLAVSDPGDLGNCVYTFEAERKDERVLCRYEWYGSDSGKHTFETDPSILDDLQKIVAGYDLAQYNGYCRSVSGLPDMYGDRLSVEYESGEQIYASDNESGFLPLDVAYDLRVLFSKASGE